MAGAADMAPGQAYYGNISAVAPGFFGHTGVELADGTCNGKREIILPKDNPNYQAIFALLLTAQSGKVPVTLYGPANGARISGYCTISEAALGRFSVWTN